MKIEITLNSTDLGELLNFSHQHQLSNLLFTPPKLRWLQHNYTITITHSYNYILHNFMSNAVMNGSNKTQVNGPGRERKL